MPTRRGPKQHSETHQQFILLAAPLLFLASELSSHITGQVLAVDGGVANQAALPVLKFGQPGSGAGS